MLRHDERWLMVLGSGIRSSGGAVLLYESMDLRRWDYSGIALTDSADEAGDMWECPNLIPFGNHWALFVSTLGRSICFVGEFDGKRFVPICKGETDLGGSLYAPQVFRDSNGRAILFGWLRERRSPELQVLAGWAGVQSIPRTILPDTSGRLSFFPAQEMEFLRRSHIHISLADNTLLKDVGGDKLEVIAELEPAEKGSCGVKMLASPDGSEETLVGYDFSSRSLFIDTTRSSISDGVAKEKRANTVQGSVNLLRVFVERSVVEAFAN